VISLVFRGGYKLAKERIGGDTPEWLREKGPWRFFKSMLPGLG
jgi:hypothetical protein